MSKNILPAKIDEEPQSLDGNQAQRKLVGDQEQSSSAKQKPVGPPCSWDTAEVGRWLQQSGFGDVAPKLAEQDVDGEVLISLTYEELRGPDFSLSLGIAKKLQKQIEKLQAEEKAASAAGSRRSPSVTASTPPYHVRTPRSTLVEAASPSLESCVRNPLAGLSHSPSRGALDTLSLVGSAAPSAVPSPFVGSAVSRQDLTPPSVIAGPSDAIIVKIVNGVSGEEEVRFPLRQQASNSEQHFLGILDKHCQQHAGYALAGLNWLSQDKAQTGERFQRRKCDLDMVEALLGEQGGSRKNAQKVLLLCTVPVRPPTELQASKIRLKTLMPDRVSLGVPEQSRLKFETTLLETNHTYTAAFTHQCSLMTYIAQATLCPNHRSLELSVPPEMISASGPQAVKEGLYDVHLVMDSEYRSNRKTFSVGSAESEMSSSSTQSAATSGFVPIIRRA